MTVIVVAAVCFCIGIITGVLCHYKGIYEVYYEVYVILINKVFECNNQNNNYVIITSFCGKNIQWEISIVFFPITAFNCKIIYTAYIIHSISQLIAC